ncbi:MAG: N(4)-(beta-N-acetylglucosaminyl)-L-asparaginase [Chitinophagales bacterium]|nr:N(4)-(beta-N-acetylglucosaminyl)-L-asparaginase [Chitinophagales bacterium]MDW8428531.1 N(4)-(beta-N-acetylglucosaminyl)-L-asparaginase [Chitinophagales bacterium]
MPSRRKFLRQTALAAGSGLLAAAWDAKQAIAQVAQSTSPQDHIVLSTWDFGLKANRKAMEILMSGGRLLDAVEEGVKVVEADPQSTSVGLNGYPDRDGYVTLDACIMDEEGNAGSVTYLQYIEHPVSVARLIMEKTPHVMLSGRGALRFALDHGFKMKKGLSPQAREAWEAWKKKTGYVPRPVSGDHDTIGLIARSADGKLAGACTTSGLAFKMHGRVGDSPIIGAGLYVDPLVGAATATGVGEYVIRICGSHTIVELMRQGVPPQQACLEALKRIVVRHKKLDNVQVGFLALHRTGAYGAYALRPGFQYALSVGASHELHAAPFMFDE